jgi:glycosyltransferase involved in cell wall biosynthesis
MFRLNDSLGGTEIMANQLVRNVIPHVPELNQHNWIIAPGEGRFSESKKNIAWVHIGEYVENLEWLYDQRLDHIVFVSNYQYRRFVEFFEGLDDKKCYVIENAIEPIQVKEKDYSSTIKLVFHSEPYRGLDVLIEAINKIDDSYDLQLQVFGDMEDSEEVWKNELHQKIKDLAKNSPRVILNNKVSNEELKEHLSNSHMFAYPATWKETSSLCLIEALSAGLYCITNNSSVLVETAIGLSDTYPFKNDPEFEANILAERIKKGYNLMKSGKFNPLEQSSRINNYYSWDTRVNDWKDFNTSISQSY